MAKRAWKTLTTTLAVEWAPKVRVNAVVVVWVETVRHCSTCQVDRSRRRRTVPLGPAGSTSADISFGVDAASYISEHGARGAQRR